MCVCEGGGGREKGREVEGYVMVGGVEGICKVPSNPILKQKSQLSLNIGSVFGSRNGVPFPRSFTLSDSQLNQHMCISWWAFFVFFYVFYKILKLL